MDDAPRASQNIVAFICSFESATLSKGKLHSRFTAREFFFVFPRGRLIIMRVTVNKEDLEDVVVESYMPGSLDLLKGGQVLVRVDHAALTANNITYAKTGNLPPLLYWNHFPVENDSKRGIVPVWGFGTVVLSGVEEQVAVGTRVNGFFPMCSLVVLTPTRVSKEGSFLDASPHRAKLPAPYLRYTSVVNDPMYVSPQFERLDAALRGLFFTGWMLRDTLAAKDCNGADTVVITSASSKTSLALAWELRHNPLRRGGVITVGLTSSGNADFCTKSGLYDKVISYNDISSSTLGGKVIYVDMAGSQTVLERIHQVISANVVPGFTVGLAHGSPLQIRHLKPKPNFYFVGDWIEHLQKTAPSRNWPAEMAKSYHKFLASSLIHLRTGDGPREAVSLYRKVLRGEISPSEVCSFTLIKGDRIPKL